MLGAGIVLGWVAYSVSSWGYVLLRGWDIPFRRWVSPLNPYTWPAGGPPPIPDNQLLPGQPGTGPQGTAPGHDTAGPFAPIAGPAAQAAASALGQAPSGGAGHPLPA